MAVVENAERVAGVAMKASEFMARFEEMWAIIGGDPDVVVAAGEDGKPEFERAALEFQSVYPNGEGWDTRDKKNTMEVICVY